MKLNAVRRSSIILSFFVFTISDIGNTAALMHTCPKQSLSSDSVLTVANEFFEALRTDDLEKFGRVTSPGFYAFDAGRNFAGNELAKFVKSAHEKGTRINWSITEPVVHLSCSTAWVTYVNKGSIEAQEGQKSVTWLESMILDYRHPQWQIQFLHSTRVPDPK